MVASQIRVILNSKVLFLEDSIFDFIKSHSGRFQVVTTTKVIEEYRKEVQSLQLVLTRLKALGDCHVRGKGGGVQRQQIRGLRKHHQNLVLEACATGCDYLVTRRQEWLDLNETLARFHLEAITPERFSQQHST